MWMLRYVSSQNLFWYVWVLPMVSQNLPVQSVTTLFWVGQEDFRLDILFIYNYVEQLCVISNMKFRQHMWYNRTANVVTLTCKDRKCMLNQPRLKIVKYQVSWNGSDGQSTYCPAHSTLGLSPTNACKCRSKLIKKAQLEYRLSRGQQVLHQS